MRLGGLLNLANSLEEYVPHARSRGYHAAASAALLLLDVVTLEAKTLEHAAQESEKCAENAS